MRGKEHPNYIGAKSQPCPSPRYHPDSGSPHSCPLEALPQQPENQPNGQNKNKRTNNPRKYIQIV